MIGRPLHRLAHLFGLNRCRIVGHLDLECVGCGKITPATHAFRETMNQLTDADIAATTFPSGEREREVERSRR